ncbi:DUF4233 domain-containing protein [Gordonia jinhuaensis]|nr:DUF4233 domain-containing protein [Gordonia jinhuaensis]
MAGTLILELIVLVLAFPIVAKVAGGIGWGSGIYLGVLCVVFILASGMQKRRHALEVDLVLQLAVIAGFAIHWSIGVVGIIFLMVWLYIAYVKRDVEKRMATGRLPGQRPVGS